MHHEKGSLQIYKDRHYSHRRCQHCLCLAPLVGKGGLQYRILRLITGQAKSSQAKPSQAMSSPVRLRPGQVRPGQARQILDDMQLFFDIEH